MTKGGLKLKKLNGLVLGCIEAKFCKKICVGKYPSDCIRGMLGVRARTAPVARQFWTACPKFYLPISPNCYGAVTATLAWLYVLILCARVAEKPQVRIPPLRELELGEDARVTVWGMPP